MRVKYMILSILVIIAIILPANKSLALTTSNVELMETASTGNPSEINTNDWKPGSTNSVQNASEFLKFANKIIGGIRIIGSIVSVIALIIIGMKFMLGSVDEKAEYKKTLKPYLIGAVLVFAITTVIGIVQALIPIS